MARKDDEQRNEIIASLLAGMATGALAFVVMFFLAEVILRLVYG